MKNLFFTLALTLFTSVAAFAQATFNLSPDTVTVIAPMDQYDVEVHNEMHNLTNAARTIKWERTIISMNPDTLLTQICDPNACYIPPVSTKTFTLNPGATVPMIVHFLNNSGQEASAIIQLKYTDLADPDNPQYSIYIFDASLTGTDEQTPAANVKLFPNPVTEFFALDNAEEVGRMRVYSFDGRQVAVFNVSADNTYSLAGQPAGAYVVALESKKGKLFQAISIRKD